MELSLIVRGQHPAGEDMRARLKDDIELVRTCRAARLQCTGQGLALQRAPLQSLQQIGCLAQAAARRLRLVCGLVLLPLHSRWTSPST
jgi:hypothetical protein